MGLGGADPLAKNERGFSSALGSYLGRKEYLIKHLFIIGKYENIASHRVTLMEELGTLFC